MSATILTWSLVGAQAMIGIAILATVYRLVKGPRAQDRVLALDAFYVCGMLMLLTFGIRTAASFYFEAALAIALLGFVSTVALAKFLMRGEVIE
ncbi:MAG: K+/H+ antiporter subunit F [Bauldia sp.]|nr:K+/H+ antiporter subunit F [Bauldia sp.]MCW5716301.1 K+/H+ antiporter subunit F [Bauldia sp.]